MIVTVGDASPRHARARGANQTATVRGRIERVEMNLEPGFHMIISVINSICRLLIGDTSPMYRSRSPTVTIIWKPGFKNDH